ncbi:DUF922 domain-containing protein [Flavihumibacter stibioxidans]|uniref:DUF922 domain-containing protein n=1 Tax=Flavihumibacter stibioxidans TaxID=1834163 RepID=A0ABR7M5I6_9BACT|nr:DUF922 domain-containing protein [Flavihumibacter stibioxidans]MBC6490278.1 hypothetical protein [Flavihumibacter stibioxidans]
MVLTQFIFLLNLFLPVPQAAAKIIAEPNRSTVNPTAENAGASQCNHSRGAFTFIRTGTAFFAFVPIAPPETIGRKISAERENINWRSRRILNWNDFKGNPVAAASNAALTSTSILINFGYDDQSLTYKIQCVFYPQKSWTKVQSNHILAHEQGHFDISQLFTRKLHKALSEYRFRAASVDRDVQKIYQQISQDQAAFQQLYDNETNYSRNLAEQKNWQDKIEKELEELKPYAGYPE